MTRSPAVFSIDLEWFTHTPAYRSASGTAATSQIGREGVEFLLDQLSRADIEATFFAVSSIAENGSDLLQRIARAGHEIGSHTQTHRLLTELDKSEVFEELVSSKEQLQQTIDQTIAGFRAPAFELPDGFFAALRDAGYRYDSSVIPCRRIPGWYGGEHTTLSPIYAEELEPGLDANIGELPVSVMPRLRLPLSGAWLRLFGVRYAVTGMQLLARQGIAPVMYLHPWELVDLPQIEGVPRRVYWRTGQWMRQAVRKLMDQPFEYTSCHGELKRVLDL